MILVFAHLGVTVSFNDYTEIERLKFVRMFCILCIMYLLYPESCKYFLYIFLRNYIAIIYTRNIMRDYFILSNFLY